MASTITTNTPSITNSSTPSGVVGATGSGSVNVKKSSPGMKLFYIVSTIFFPPLSVAVRTGDVCETAINVGWCFLGYIPAVVHSAMVSFGDTRCSCAPEAAMAVPPGEMIDNTVRERQRLHVASQQQATRVV